MALILVDFPSVYIYIYKTGLEKAACFSLARGCESFLVVWSNYLFLKMGNVSFRYYLFIYFVTSWLSRLLNWLVELWLFCLVSFIIHTKILSLIINLFIFPSPQSFIKNNYICKHIYLLSQQGDRLTDCLSLYVYSISKKYHNCFSCGIAINLLRVGLCMN